MNRPFKKYGGLMRFLFAEDSNYSKNLNNFEPNNHQGGSRRNPNHPKSSNHSLLGTWICGIWLESLDNKGGEFPTRRCPLSCGIHRRPHRGLFKPDNIIFCHSMHITGNKADVRENFLIYVLPNCLDDGNEFVEKILINSHTYNRVY